GGMPRPVEARRLCARSGADRYLLGSFKKQGKPEGGGEKILATFYSGSASGGDMDVFKTTADGGYECIPALALHVAGKVCRLPKNVSTFRDSSDFIPSFSHLLQLVRYGKMAEASKKAEKLSADHPESADARYVGALAALGAKKPYAALRLFNEARNLDPSVSMPASKKEG
ncbi:MAG: hypothetical protein P8123_11380, partial [bacterium]